MQVLINLLGLPWATQREGQLAYLQLLKRAGNSRSKQPACTLGLFQRVDLEGSSWAERPLRLKKSSDDSLNPKPSAQKPTFEGLWNQSSKREVSGCGLGDAAAWPASPQSPEP